MISRSTHGQPSLLATARPTSMPAVPISREMTIAATHRRYRAGAPAGKQGICARPGSQPAPRGSRHGARYRAGRGGAAPRHLIRGHTRVRSRLSPGPSSSPDRKSGLDPRSRKVTFAASYIATVRCRTTIRTPDRRRGETMALRFRDRGEAGRLLATKLRAYAGRPDVLVLALPRGGVPVAYEVARALGAPLDVFLVRKLGVPGHEELAMGAVATGGVRVLNDDVVRALQIPESMIDAVAAREQHELARRERLYRGNRPPPDVRGRTVILVDDGLATGATMHAAVKALRQQQPGRIVVAVPTASPEICEELRAEVDEVICAITPDPFYAVGLWYEDFSQTTDEEVRELLARSERAGRAA